MGKDSRDPALLPVSSFLTGSFVSLANDGVVYPVCPPTAEGPLEPEEGRAWALGGEEMRREAGLAAGARPNLLGCLSYGNPALCCSVLGSQQNQTANCGDFPYTLSAHLLTQEEGLICAFIY